VSGNRPGVWRDLSLTISRTRDYLFFLKPFFGNAARLREKVEIRIAPAFV
jgi:hypothetical protein